MIKIPITIIALYLSIATAFAQADTAQLSTRKLTLEEINFVSSYYHQDGNNAAVTGGIGSEKLNDYASTLDIKLTRLDSRKRRHFYTAEIGLDVYTSASSDKIDPTTITSASYLDARVYPSLSWSRVDDQKGKTVGASFSVSAEYDYLSVGAGVNAYKDSRDKLRQVGLRLQTYQDFVTLIYPIEQRASHQGGGTEQRKTYAATASISQIFNKRLQALFMVDFAYQQGFLSTSFNRVYFRNNSVGIEKLPGTRFKWPLSARLHYFAGDRFIIRSFYRYYVDTWQLEAHTAELETVVKITPFVSVSPFYRYYAQSAIPYFKPYREHEAENTYYTSDYDLSTFKSHAAGIGFRRVSPDGIFGISQFNALEIRYAHYNRQTGLIANMVSLHTRWK